MFIIKNKKECSAIIRDKTVFAMCKATLCPNIHGIRVDRKSNAHTNIMDTDDGGRVTKQNVKTANRWKSVIVMVYTQLS